MKFIDCPRLNTVQCENNPLDGSLQFVNCFENPPNYEEHIVLNNTQATVLDFSPSSRWGDNVIRIKACNSPNLQNVLINMGTPYSLDCSDCPQLDENLSVSMAGITELTLDRCSKLTHLKVNNCPKLKTIHANSCSNLTQLTITDCEELDAINSAQNLQLNTISITNASRLRVMNCEGNENLTTLICSNKTRSFYNSSELIYNTLTSLTHLTLKNWDLPYGNYVPPFKNTLQYFSGGGGDLSGYSALTHLVTSNFVSSLEGCTALTRIELKGSNAAYLEVLRPCTSATIYITDGSGEIPLWLKSYNIKFYPKRYMYFYLNYPYGPNNPGEYGTDWTYADNGYGWYYPGEPTKGYSGW